MFAPKPLVFASLAVATLLLGGTLAHTDTAVPNGDNDVEFQCDFNGGGSGKTGDWQKTCRADGHFTRDDRDLGNDDNDPRHNHLKVECFRDDDGFRVIYDDGAHVRFDHFARALSIDGIAHHAPSIVIDLGDRDNSTLDDDHSHSADLAFTQDGFEYEIPGRCHLHPAPTPTPSPSCSPSPSPTVTLSPIPSTR